MDAYTIGTLILAILIIALVIFFLVKYNKRQQVESYDNYDKDEGMENANFPENSPPSNPSGSGYMSVGGDIPLQNPQQQTQQTMSNPHIAQIPQPSTETVSGNEIFKGLHNPTNMGSEYGGNRLPKDCFPKDQVTPSELLPGDANSTWAQVNPVGQGDLIDKNFLEAGYHVGINTVGQSNRNPNLQLRSEPPNPQVQVSPWMQSSIGPDLSRRPMEIGSY